MVIIVGLTFTISVYLIFKLIFSSLNFLGEFDSSLFLSNPYLILLFVFSIIPFLAAIKFMPEYKEASITDGDD